MLLDISADVICLDNCTVAGTGKAVKFDFLFPTAILTVQPSADINITPGSTSIEIHGWTQEPNTSLIGREFIGTVSSNGGEVQIPTGYKWLSAFARNVNNGNVYDGCCILIESGIIKIVDFGT